MSSQYDRGVSVLPTWHRQEEIVSMSSGDELVAHMLRVGALPTSVTEEGLWTSHGLRVDSTHRAIVASYQGHPDRVVGVVRGRYQAVDPSEFKALVTAACYAGAVPDGGFALDDGRRTIAAFTLPSAPEGFSSHFVIADSYDGTTQLMAGGTMIRVVCSNTMAAARGRDGKGWATARHDSSLSDKIEVMASAIGDSITRGVATAETYAEAEETALTRDGFEHLFDRLFPKAPEGASRKLVTMRDNARGDAMAAMAHPVNRAHDGRNVASLWNAATYLVDRKADGTPRGSQDALVGGLLFGAQAKRVEEIGHIIEVMMSDGTCEHMTSYEATAAGVDTGQIGSSILDAMLE